MMSLYLPTNTCAELKCMSRFCWVLATFCESKRQRFEFAENNLNLNGSELNFFWFQCLIFNNSLNCKSINNSKKCNTFQIHSFCSCKHIPFRSTCPIRNKNDQAVLKCRNCKISFKRMTVIRWKPFEFSAYFCLFLLSIKLVSDIIANIKLNIICID